MTDKLIVKDFGSLKDININIKKYNIFIGENGVEKHDLFNLIKLFRNDVLSIGTIKELIESCKISNDFIINYYYAEMKKLIQIINKNNNLKIELPIELDSKIINSVFFLNNPENNLHPMVQRRLVNNVIPLYKDTGLIMETNSPYILTQLNNCIQANNLYKSLNKNDLYKVESLKEIMPKSNWINFEDISVYSINSGISVDIKNYKNNLIEVNNIDIVSDIICEEFNQLLELEFGE